MQQSDTFASSKVKSPSKKSEKKCFIFIQKRKLFSLTGNVFTFSQKRKIYF